MRVLLVAVGSRGDVAPFTGLGVALRDAGHDVFIASYELFGGMITGCGLGFRALPGDPELMGASDEGRRWQRGGGGPMGLARFIRLIAGHMRDLNAGILGAARDGADVMLLSGLGVTGGFHIAKGLGLPSAGLALQPLHPTADFPPPMIAARSLGRWGNRAAAKAMVALGSPAMGAPVRELRAELGLPRLSTRAAVMGQQDAEDWPIFHGFSPSVVPRPADWRHGLQVVGYWWPARPADWSPPGDLESFLAAGPPPVFIGFGSSNTADADRISSLVAAAGRRAGVRMVIQAGWAGLTAAGPASDRGARDDAIVIGEVPHEWLFPRVAAVVHHAGAGTTAAGLRAGVPAVGVPSVTDQPFWAGRLAALGAGPRPIRYRHLSAEALGAAITDAVTRPSYKDRAQALADRISREDGARPVLDWLSRLGS